MREDWGGWVSIYYRLKDKYKLRGWELLPYALVDSEMRRTHFVQKAEFDALTLCDGTVDLALPLISQAIRDSVAKLEAQDAELSLEELDKFAGGEIRQASD